MLNHPPAVLLPGEKPTVATEYDADWASGTVGRM